MRILFVLFLLASSAFAGEPVYSWRTNDTDPDRVYLYRDGQQIGGWCYKAKQYRPLNGEEWGTPVAKAPVQPPVRKNVVVVPMKPIVITPQNVRGPFRRVGATMGDAIAQFTVNLMFDAIPKAVVQSVVSGQTPVEIQLATSRTVESKDGQTLPATQSTTRRWTVPRR
ncbi:MAG: hypothetical protein KF873_08885 [Gemmataceae bacterium]|nr:hypothetical protein [Gemmataceae bacterium]